MPIPGGVTFIGSNAQVGADVIKTGNILDAEIVNADISATAAIARTKLANVSATSKILGRKTAGAGADEEMSLSDVLDFIGSATKGDILVRDTSAWARLAAGAAGTLLTGNGAGTLPSFTVFAGVTYKNGKSTHDSSTTGDQTIAHGLGAVPKKLKITALCTSTLFAASHGVTDGTTLVNIHSGGVIGAGTSSSTTKIIRLIGLAAGAGNISECTVAIDATNIVLSWTKTASPTGTAEFVWEVEA